MTKPTTTKAQRIANISNGRAGGRPRLYVATVRVETWGTGDGRELGSFDVRVRADDHSPVDAAMRAIVRRSGLEFCGGPRDDGRNSEGDCIYQATLGRRCSSGGWTPEGQIWFLLPRVLSWAVKT